MEMTLSTDEFQLFKDLVYQEVGISLSENKQSLIVSRLSKRVRELALSSYQAYYDFVVSRENPKELTKLLDLISTNKTDFFREPGHFDFLRDHIVPTLASQKSIRIWCSASSTGEEPYTIAMTLWDAIDQPTQWNCKILASDISTRVLEKAAKGIYEDERVQSLPSDLVRRHFLRGKGEQHGFVKIKPLLSKMITFRRINLMDEAFPIRSPLDVIFCRNVMIYFDRPTQAKLMAKFNRYLKPGGYLFIGHSESLQWIEHPFSYVAPTIYQKAY